MNVFREKESINDYTFKYRDIIFEPKLLRSSSFKRNSAHFK